MPGTHTTPALDEALSSLLDWMGERDAPASREDAERALQALVDQGYDRGRTPDQTAALALVLSVAIDKAPVIFFATVGGEYGNAEQVTTDVFNRFVAPVALEAGRWLALRTRSSAAPVDYRDQLMSFINLNWRTIISRM